MYYSCNCGGTYKEFYAKQKYPEYEIRLRPRLNVGSILMKNFVVATFTIDKLEMKMKEHGIND